CIGCGLLRESSVTRDLAAAPGIRAGIVQGNLSTKEKGDVRYLDVNLERYRSVSAQVIAEGAEVLFWPESVMNQWTPEDLPNVRGTKADPFPAAAVPLVYGGLAYRLKPEMHGELAESHAAAQRKRHFSFNTAFGLDEHGNVTGVYHKQVLMPFGEYMPFADIFPALRALSPHTGDFTPGDRKAPIVLQVKRAAQNSAPVSLRAGALICYEDLVPSLSREAVAHGANILVNLTNDAWYGKTAAPYQHNLLAQWRAIETRRYLLRVTNTGLTAVIDPLGRTVQQLPLFSEGYLISDVRLLNAVTVYSKVGDLPVWVISAISLLYCFRRRKA
ncbi:MAG TPA: apolipoprotein N-acyltransferase, partial [Oligoflexia bacterium]|nr:apolipoprotein N-acyltransferase [Oligoflexia bacterium]